MPLFLFCKSSMVQDMISKLSSVSDGIEDDGYYTVEIERVREDDLDGVASPLLETQTQKLQSQLSEKDKSLCVVPALAKPKPRPNPKPKSKEYEDEASFETKVESSIQKCCRAYEAENNKRRTIKRVDFKGLPGKTQSKVIH